MIIIIMNYEILKGEIKWVILKAKCKDLGSF
ncbi:hypothetical protein SFB3_338G0 [Candidatus Arthromitus sp. SFB-3]|nr:hypothetical protein SFB3_338G0 [Candidatus Arthromitus sp. SFB-3]